MRRLSQMAFCMPMMSHSQGTPLSWCSQLIVTGLSLHQELWATPHAMVWENYGLASDIELTGTTSHVSLNNCFDKNLQDWLNFSLLILCSYFVRYYIAVHEMINFLGRNISRALPGFTSFTGCDTTAGFMSRGKTLSWRAWQECLAVTTAFLFMISPSLPLPRLTRHMMALQQFTSRLYGD